MYLIIAAGRANMRAYDRVLKIINRIFWAKDSYLFLTTLLDWYVLPDSSRLYVRVYMLSSTCVAKDSLVRS